MHAMSQGWCNVYTVYTVYCVTLYVRCTMLMHAMSQGWCNVYAVYYVLCNAVCQVYYAHARYVTKLVQCVHCVLCNTVYTCSTKRKEKEESSNLDQRRFIMALFRYLCPNDSALDTQGPFSQAVPCVMAEEANTETRSTTNRKQGQHLSSNTEKPKVPF